LDIETDSEKDRLNRNKHGVSLALAGELDRDSALVWIDNRFFYNELRMIALAPDKRTLYYVSFVENDNVARIIILRRATRREADHYVKNI